MCIKKWEEVLKAKGKSEATVKSYISKAQSFIDWLELNGLEVEGRDTADDYILHLSKPKRGLTPLTINNYFTIAKEYAKYLGKKSESGTTRWLLEQGIAKASVTNERLPLELNQLQTLIDYARVKQKSEKTQQVRDGLLIELMLIRGLRTIELTRLKKIDLFDSYINILGKGKSRKIDLTIPLRLYKALLKYSKGNTSEYLFPSVQGKQLDTSLIRRMYKKALFEGLNISSDKYNAHGCRYTLTQILRNKGISNDGEHGIKRLLRHEDNSTINAYMGDAGVTQRRESKDRIENIIDKYIKIRSEK